LDNFNQLDDINSDTNNCIHNNNHILDTNIYDDISIVPGTPEAAEAVTFTTSGKYTKFK